MNSIKKFSKKYAIFMIIYFICFNVFGQEDKVNSILDIYSGENTERIQQFEEQLKIANGIQLQKFDTKEDVTLYEDKNLNLSYIQKNYDYETFDDPDDPIGDPLDNSTNYVNKTIAEEEVFAYKLNKILNLKIVPPTIFFQSTTDKNIYIVRQLYIKDTITHPKMGLMVKRIKEFKKKGSPLVVFDNIIGHSDREHNNFLYSHDGSIVAIDHENLFNSELFYENPNANRPKTLLEKVWKKKTTYFDEEDIKSFFYDKEIWDKFTTVDWQTWTDENIPEAHRLKVDDKISSQEIFLKKLDLLKQETNLLLERQGVKKFFSSAAELRNRYMEKRKTFYAKKRGEEIENKRMMERRRFITIPGEC